MAKFSSAQHGRKRRNSTIVETTYRCSDGDNTSEEEEEGEDEPRMSEEQPDDDNGQQKKGGGKSPPETRSRKKGRQKPPPFFHPAAASATASARAGSATIHLSDSEVLDCPICLDPLFTPIFQCDNGHVACSSCCVSLDYTCPFCSLPVGYSRCRAMEKILESSQISCKNLIYGCKEVLAYNARIEHESCCPFAPVQCPLGAQICSFLGSREDLPQHFKTVHRVSCTNFQYDRRLDVWVDKDKNFHVFLEEGDGNIFILNNNVKPLGNAVTVSRFYEDGGGSDESFWYELSVSNGDICLKMESKSMNNYKASDATRNLKSFLLLPKGFNGIAQKF